MLCTSTSSDQDLSRRAQAGLAAEGMVPKRSAQSSPRTPTKKIKKSNGSSNQQTLNAFFTSPSKSAKKANGNSKDDVIDIVSSDDEPAPERRLRTAKNQRELQIEADEKMARRLARDGSLEETNSISGNGLIFEGPSEKGKQKAVQVSEEPTEPSNDDDFEIMEPEPRPDPDAPSSSRVKLEPLKPNTKPKTPLASIFDKPILPRPLLPSEKPVEPKIDTKPNIFGGKPNPAFPATVPIEPFDFDVDAFKFNPHDPAVVEKVNKQWPGGRLPYAVLVGIYVQVSATRSRLLIVRLLTNFIHLLIVHCPIDLPPAIYLLSNHLRPSYIPFELGIGSQILNKQVAEVSGLQAREMRKLWEKWGDPGDVAYESKSNVRTIVTPTPLLVHSLYEQLLKIASIKGMRSGKMKGDIVRKLLVQAKGEEVRFLVRSFVGNLRIGAVRLTLLTAIARAFTLSEPLHPCPLHASRAELDSIKPLPAPVDKGMRKPKIEPDPIRDLVDAKCVKANAIVRRVYVRHPNFDDLLRGLREGGLDQLDIRVPLSVGIPLSPMLGSITRSMDEVFTRLNGLQFTAEAKLDGQRVQIHARTDGPSGEPDGGGTWIEGEDGHKVWVRLFSRHLEDMTEKYPDVSALISRLLSRPVPIDPAPVPSHFSQPAPTILSLLASKAITSLIIDAEIVAVDKDTGAFRTFQQLSNRAKKDVKVEDITVIVGVFAFDLMLLNDEPLLGHPFSHRRHLLRTLFPKYENLEDLSLARFDHVESIDSTKPEDVQAFFEMVVAQKCEGLMVKLLESGEGISGEDDVEDDEGEGKLKKGKGGRKKPLPATYEPDQRSQGWLKVKKDYLEGLGDSLDLVPIGAWWGQGRKAGWWSPILLALHNTETGALEAVCKCISGFSDAFYKDLLVRFPPEGNPEKCSKSPLGYYETNGLTPDFWFDPCEVWEIRGADITLSPVYPAAASLLGGERGLSLRFPRFMKRREDKSWEQATSAAQFAGMYRKQMEAAPARNVAGADSETVGAIIKEISEDEEEEDLEENA